MNDARWLPFYPNIMRSHPIPRSIGWLAILFFFALPGCNASISQPMLQEALVGNCKTPEALTAICGRPITQLEANQAGMGLKFKNVVASRPFTGVDGKGTAEVEYASNSGAPCSGTMAFDFRQNTTMKQYSKRNVTYSSVFELSNVAFAKK